ncbi:MAG TPA: ABC transporter ATP-binding protein [Methylomirabilota bacterium]|nr:ABC transporter ATP-binding protein [Methylomirabilota bacterium]
MISTAADAGLAVLALRDVRVGYGDRTVLEVPALDVPEGEVLAVIGPNGAGKSTLLRMLALLEPPARGTVAFRGAPVRTAAERLACRRRMTSVFRDPLLCDTTVAANARLPLAFRGVGRVEAVRRVQPWLERLGIAHLADRAARTLSGGEAQRTSLARAFAAEPEVLFLDEPFAALDPPTRDTLLDDLARLLAESRTTALFVTHDRAEALRLGDRVAVLMNGRLAQVGRPEDVFGAPADEAVARLVGVENLLPGRVVATRDGLVEVAVARHTIAVAGQARAGEQALVGVRPEDIVLERGGPRAPTSARNRLPATVAAVTSLGPLYRVTLDCGLRLTAVVTRPSVEALGLAPGVAVTASFKATAAHLIRSERPN